VCGESDTPWAFFGFFGLFVAHKVDGCIIVRRCSQFRHARGKAPISSPLVADLLSISVLGQCLGWCLVVMKCGQGRESTVSSMAGKPKPDKMMMSFGGAWKRHDNPSLTGWEGGANRLMTVYWRILHPYSGRIRASQVHYRTKVSVRAYVCPRSTHLERRVHYFAFLPFLASSIRVRRKTGVEANTVRLLLCSTIFMDDAFQAVKFVQRRCRSLVSEHLAPMVEQYLQRCPITNWGVLMMQIPIRHISDFLDRMQVHIALVHENPRFLQPALRLIIRRPCFYLASARNSRAAAVVFGLERNA
jgi:hypothetical protein